MIWWLQRATAAILSQLVSSGKLNPVKFNSAVIYPGEQVFNRVLIMSDQGSKLENSDGKMHDLLCKTTISIQKATG